MDIDEFANDGETSELYLEDLRDLKNEDPNTKIHAVSKLCSVTQIIGKNRFQAEILPRLVEIIEDKNSEDEFLLKLCEQIGQVKDIIGVSEAYLLLKPLEALCSIDEPGIRDKAVQQVKLIAENQNQLFFQTHLFPLIKNLAKSENYSQKIAGCSLFAACYPHIDEIGKLEIKQLFVDLASHNMSVVRRSVANNLKNMIEVVDRNFIKTGIIPLFNILMKDDVDSVKINAIENSISLIPFFSKQEITDNLISLLKNTDPELKSWRVRYALPEALAGFCSEIEIEIVRKEIFPIFENLLSDTEPEVRSRTLQKLPEIFDNLTEEQLLRDFIMKLKNLVSDSSLHVRLEVTNVISKLCSALRKDQLLTHLLPLVQILLKDEIINVKIAAIKILSSLKEKVETYNIETEMFPIMEDISREKQWRCRLSLTEALPEICQGMGDEIFKTKFLDFIFDFIKDHYCAIREQTIENIYKFIQFFGFAPLSEKIIATIESLIVADNYLFRVTAIKLMNKIHQNFDLETYKTVLGSFMDNLGKDKVPNVRLNLVQSFDNQLERIPKSLIQSHIKPLLEKLNEDVDSDVAYFSNKTFIKL